ncbi:hypothetical protein ABZ464_50245 [Streptomyces sp. NPDC005820]|uniref:hypothetical protein n=1 Tax=Streptomyces sp. NPDC005820 TaxID=3157069 RepID=UPI0033F9257C
MSERMKPPARRTGGRTLGGAAKKTAPPPPPPAAELTPEQYAAEQTATRVTAQTSANTLQAETAVASTPVAAYGETDVAAADAPSAAADPPSDAAWEAARGQSPHVAGTTSDPSPVTVEESVTPAHGHGEPPVVLGSSVVEVHGAAPAAEVAVRPATSPAPTSTAFPVHGAEPTPGHNHGTRSSEAPNEAAPWAQGPGRPEDIPEVSVLLNQRVIARESFDSSVPAALRLKRRIKRFALDNELDHLPIGDIVAVAMDEWLTTRGF